MKGGAPRRVSDLLRSRPELAGRLMEARLRQHWRELVGPDVARQAQPLFFREGSLTVGVASSPWLHQLTLLADQLRDCLNRTLGPGAVRELRFQIHAVAPPTAASSPNRPPRELGPEEFHAIDQALAPIRDPALNAVLRRLMTKARRDQARRPGEGALTS